MKILFTTPVLQYPSMGGPALRITNSIKALSRIAETHILSRVTSSFMGGYEAEKYFTGMCNYFEYAPSVKIGHIKKVLIYRFKTDISVLNIILNLPLQVLCRIANLGNSKKDSVYIANYARMNQIDIIWFGFGNISFKLMKQVKERLPDIKMVCDTDSVWSRFILRELITLNDSKLRHKIELEGRKKEEEEKEWSKFMDVTTAVSEIDAKYYRTIASDVKKVKLFSNVIDLDMYAIKPEPPRDFKRPCIYLAGSFWERCPMEHAARWIINEVLPIVNQAIPNIHFYIIGSNSDKILDDINEPNITITGRLDSVLPFLCNADVSIVPLFFESGTRFKILEAGACEIPIVTTTLGAEGIPVTHGKELLIANNAKEFAEAIILVIQNREYSKVLTKNCRKLIEKNYSIDVLVEEGKIILHGLFEGELIIN